MLPLLEVVIKPEVVLVVQSFVGATKLTSSSGVHWLGIFLYKIKLGIQNA